MVIFMNKKYFIFSDVDGTLFSHAQCGIPSSSLEAIKKARENGHKVFISSGRGKHMIDYDDYKIDIDGFILCNGSHIILNNKDVYLDFMDKDQLKDILDLCVENKIGFLLEGIYENYLYGYGIDVIYDFERRCLNRMDLSDEQAGMSLASHHVVCFDKFKHDYENYLKLNVYFSNPEQLNLTLNHLGDNLNAIYDKKDTASIKSIEIMAKNNTKATGIDKIIEYYNHPLTQTIALGDGKNDLEMVMHAGIGIAMGNANIVLKENADYVTKHIDDDGFEYALKEYKII